MKTITIENTQLSDTKPKIAVPITGKDDAEIEQQLALIDTASVDLIELRIDFLAVLNEATIKSAKQLIQTSFPKTPIIATLRTTTEGGNFNPIEHDYPAVLKVIIKTGFHLVDVEINQLGAASIIDLAHQHHQLVIGSHHNFKQTPDDHFLAQKWQSMQALNCDIAKIAVMPTNVDDVLRFMTASHRANQSLMIPIISMAMGALGIITRISGQLTGSVITFGSITNKAQSAPGQITSPQLATILQVVAPQ
ncbi:type I 3-dehydroquinate dehydratase (plasmid) [Nicoliella spurrieriana]|uniref:3-dehydroquinate dehydratase n=1 Tax=Nicoliella spurrieriana TaxID=2925830 RepID=A0A976RQJ4_9LACO|nr:type I 3-dehydroquinate dehydratase [Nicoliella spurrieriana]UQS86014.1 type I 3-dehydroquinate dehydratase [Nicoliella spurrieriana]